MTGHYKSYASSMIENDRRWHRFVGICYLACVVNDWPLDKVNEYIFECFHSFSLEELPSHREAIIDDLELFINGK